MTEALIKLVGFDQDEINVIDDQDRTAVRFLTCYFFGVHDSSPVPKACMGKVDLLMAFLRVRVFAIGRHEGWREIGLVSEDLRVCWLQVGCYTLIYEGMW